MSDTVEKRVIMVVSEILEIPETKISMDARFVEDLDAESIQSVELMAALEEEFDIEMDEDEAMNIKTVASAVEYVEKCIGEQHG